MAVDTGQGIYNTQQVEGITTGQQDAQKGQVSYILASFPGLETDWYCCLRIHKLSEVFMGFVIFYIELVHSPFLKDGV